MIRFLEKILESRRDQLNRDIVRTLLSVLKEEPHEIPMRLFVEALKRHEWIRIIAEIKRASPSKGYFGTHVSPASLAMSYEQGGAVAISVLTEEKYFCGSFEDLRSVKSRTHLPVLCKDFIFDSYQVYQARHNGADAVLLIMAILDENQYLELHKLALELEMTPVVEIHEAKELESALRAPVQVIGVNRRDLRSFDVDSARAEFIVNKLPENILRIVESAIQCKEDVHSLHQKGYHACLVGEALVRSENPMELLQSWITT